MINALIHVITLRKAEIAKSVADGIPVSWDAYQRMVGENQGLQSILDMINNMLEEERNLD